MLLEQTRCAEGSDECTRGTELSLHATLSTQGTTEHTAARCHLATPTYNSCCSVAAAAAADDDRGAGGGRFYYSLHEINTSGDHYLVELHRW